METIIFYLFEYAFYLLAFYLLYLLLFKGKKDHQFNRFYLTSSSIICLIIPMLPKAFYTSNPEMFAILLEPIEIGAKGTAEIISQGNESLPLLAIIALCYLSITVLMACKFIYGLAKINRYKKNGLKDVYKNNFIIESDEVKVPFSFFNHIYLPKGQYNTEEKELIIEHEMTHIKFGHSAEKILFLVNKVFFWWNPISHRYFRELELVHEYQVDEKLCQSSGKKFYSNFLLNQINSPAQYVFVNNISSHIKNRIMMISSNNKTTPSLLKWGSYLGLFFAVLFLHSCDVENDEPLIEDNYKQYEKVEKVVIPEGDSESLEVIDTISVFDTKTKEETTRIVKSQVQVYKQPEVMPVFGDCAHIDDVEAKYECSNQNLLTFIYSNLTYPKEAKDNGVEGMCVIQFVVGPNGTILGQDIVRSIGNGTDEAVDNVINKMNEVGNLWTPGRQGGQNVATQFTLPVKFKLEG